MLIASASFPIIAMYIRHGVEVILFFSMKEFSMMNRLKTRVTDAGTLESVKRIMDGTHWGEGGGWHFRTASAQH